MVRTGEGARCVEREVEAALVQWWRKAPAAVAAVAVLVAVGAVTVVVLEPEDGAEPTASLPEPPPPMPAPDVTETVTVSPSASKSSSKPSKKPDKPKKPKEPKPSESSSKPPPKGPPPSVPPGQAVDVQMVNRDSGLCLDIADGDMEKGTDVIAADCTGSATQQWTLDRGNLMLRSAADSDFCLDSRGDVDKGVGIWACSSADGDNGENLRFGMTSDGALRPFIAPEFAVTPDGSESGSGVSFDYAEGEKDQHWRFVD